MSVLSDPSELSTVDQSNSGLSKLLCCECGLPIPANSPTFVCASCIASTADVTSHISTEAQLHQCRGCQRWHKEDAKWLGCELESRELMALCLHKVSGLKNVKLVDASWVWTEPHSMRIKTKVSYSSFIHFRFTFHFISLNVSIFAAHYPEAGRTGCHSPAILLGRFRG